MEFIYDIKPIEYPAFLFGIIYVILAAKKSQWCWPAGIISVVCWIVIGWETNFVMDVLLNIYYLIISFYGWYLWRSKSDKHDNSDQKFVRLFSFKKHILLIVTALVFSFLLGAIFSRFGTNLPYLDAFTTVFSLITTWMVTQRYLYNWIYWIVIDIVIFYMYFSVEAYYLSSSLYLVYAIIAIFGFIEWKSEKKLLA